MTKSELAPGMVVEMRDGEMCLLTHDQRFYTLDGGMWHCELNDFRDDLTTDEHDYDIVRVYSDYTLIKELWERELNNNKREKLQAIFKAIEELLEEVE